jgi:hypothetical protein
MIGLPRGRHSPFGGQLRSGLAMVELHPTLHNPAGTRIVVHRTIGSKQWSAWSVDRPDERSSAANAADAVWNLLQIWGIDLGTARIMPDRENCSSEEGHFEMLVLPHKIACPDCKGSGTYVGLSVVETCHRCAGGGLVPRE